MGHIKEKVLIVVTALIVGGLGFSGGYMATRNQEPPIENIIENVIVEEVTVVCGSEFDTFVEVMDLLIEHHYKRPTEADLMQGAIEGMIESIEDPHTTYFDYEEAQQFNDNFGEDYVGIGVQVRYENETLVIDGVFADSPAYNAGIRVNDVITHIDGELVVGLEFYDIVGKLVGDENTDVTVGVFRAGFEDTLYFVMTRSVIENPSVEFETFEQNGETIGYIKVTTFGDETFQKFYDAIDDLETIGIDGLIIDLRNNGGGHLSTVLNMLQEFLINDGIEMFSTEHYISGVKETDNYYAYRGSARDYDIVTLVNENSASASEVFATAMQEHGDYTVLGTVTYGKGTMQTDMDLDSTVGDSLHISVGKWLTSDGNWVHFDGGSDGVIPDVIVEVSEVEKAYKVFLLDGGSILVDTVDTRTANIQIILNAVGYTVRTDGYFDLVTEAAIEDIQTSNTLTVNGEINAETLDIINTLLHNLQNNSDNDTQLQAAISHLVND